MTIKKVDTEEYTKMCDDLLTELIQEERMYDNNIKETYKVEKMYCYQINKDNSCLLLILNKEEPVGFLFGYLKHSKGEFCYNSTGKIEALYIKPNYRKKGYATKLIEEYQLWCKEKEIKEIEIGVFQKNTNAYKLYSKLGFINNIIYMKKEA